MAVRSSVLAPPPAPAPRATVVLRAGPSPRKGADVVVGLVGLLLLLSTVGMAVALPHKDVLTQQFKVAYVDEPHDLPTQTFQFTGGERSHDFLYEVPDDDAYLVTVKYEFADDVPASLPEEFSLQLYDAGGNTVGPEVVAINAPGVAATIVGQGQANVTMEYKAPLLTAQFSVALPKPADDIVEVADQSMTPQGLAKDLERKAHLDTHGTWKLRVNLIQLGDCPDASGGKEAANRAAICHQELQDAGATPQDAAQGKDPGNLFTVGVFSYSRFAPDVQKIG